MSILPTLRPSDLLSVEALQAKLDAHPDGISSWITPLILQGHVEDVMWIRQGFCKQMPKVVKGRLGWVPCEEDDDDCCCRVEVVEGATDYWEGEQTSKDPKALKNAKEFRVVEDLPENGVEGKWILDVCLDYFSVANPWLENMPLKEVFSKADKADVKKWCDDPGTAPEAVGEVLEDEAVRAEVARAVPYLDLPHRPGLHQKVFEGFLADLRAQRTPPMAVTIARSVEDGFIPRKDVDEALRRVMEALEERGWGGGEVLIEDP